MSLEQVCIESLATHIRTWVPDCGTVAGTTVSVPSLAMEFRAEEATPSALDETQVVSVFFEGRPLGATEPGVRVMALGVGPTLDEAARDAGHQWAAGVLPVLISYLLADTPVAEVGKWPMIVGVPDSGERFGWTVHVGPVLSRLYGPPDAGEIDQGDLSQASAYQPIFEVLHPFAAHRQTMWIESFAVRYPENRVDATSRLQNQDWPEGRNALLAWAASWPDTGPCALSKRQFLLLQPTLVEQLESSADLTMRLECEMGKTRRPWWRRILGGF